MAESPDVPADQRTSAVNPSPSLAEKLAEVSEVDERRPVESVHLGPNVSDTVQASTTSAAESAASGPAPVIDSVSGTETASSAAGAQPAQQTPLTDQIAARMNVSDARDGKEVVVHMDPPELGKVRISFREQGGQLQGIIRADNPETLSDLQRETPHLLARLQEAGIQIKTLDLQGGDLANQQQSDRGQQAQQTYSQFTDSGAQGRGEDGSHPQQQSPPTGLRAWTDDPLGAEPPVGQYVSETTLNVMI